MIEDKSFTKEWIDALRGREGYAKAHPEIMEKMIHSLYLVEKLVNLRMFQDENDKMNCSLIDIQGEALIVSQFTLYADCKEGRRPSFTESAEPLLAERLYNKFISELKAHLHNVETGIFGAKMRVSLINDGPVTFIIDGKK